MYFAMQDMSKDPIPPRLTRPHLSLKKIRIEIIDFGHKEVEITSFLLQSMHTLETLEFWLPNDTYNRHQFLKFSKDVKCVHIASLLARIMLLDEECNPIGSPL